MKQLSKLEQEFIRVKLFGFHPSKRPRKAETVAAELRREWGKTAAEREQEVNAVLRQIIEFGQKACEIRRYPEADRELAHFNLMDTCADHSELALQFARQCYNDGQLPAAVQELAASFEKSAKDSADFSLCREYCRRRHNPPH